MAENQSEIRYLNPINIEVTKSKYCRFKKSGIKFIDYKDPKFLVKFINEQGKLLPRRLTGTSAKYQDDRCRRRFDRVLARTDQGAASRPGFGGR